MELVFEINQSWHDIVVLTHSVLEMFVRGSIMYLFIFAGGIGGAGSSCATSYLSQE
jgi:hypothetical protein